MKQQQRERSNGYNGFRKDGASQLHQSVQDE
ncbi:hypothetical protein PEC331060_07420 [Pectobacterium carotovorum subsp. carotovorum]|nr:hypothetical protein PEC331060_07420 [Pectobacterium carotovorum subsp. carotovorum]